MIKLATIGLRNIGKAHIRRTQTIDGVRMVAAADLDEEQCKLAEEEFDLDYTCTDAEKLYADPDIDGVVVALPNHLHAPVSVAALEAGKHVLCEKPVSHKSSDVQAMIDARDKSGKTLMIGMNQRFSPEVYALREQLRTGVIGDVYLAKTAWCIRYIPEGLLSRGSWGFKKEVAGGGPMLDLGIHKLDQTLFMLDFPEIESVTGVVSTGIGSADCKERGIEYDIEDYSMGLIRLKNGATIQVEASYYHNTPEHLSSIGHLFCGQKGYINDGNVVSMVKGEEVSVAWTPDETAPKTCVEHFARVLKGEEELVPTCEQALIGLKIMEAIYESAESGQTIKFV